MNNLTTRKIVLGMLVTFVLAFSVQGIAEALTFSTSRSGDLETEVPDDRFDIRFSVSLKGNTSIKNTDGNLVNEDGARIDSSGYLLVADTDDSDDDGDSDELIRGDKTADGTRYYYDQEAITITVSDANIRKIGSYEFTGTKTSHVLTETGSNDTKNRLTSSVTVVLEASAAGEVTVEITDTTSENDVPTNGKADPINFRVYIVEHGLDVAANTTTIAFGGVSNGVQFRDDRESPILVTVTGDANIPIRFKVEGSGRFYVKEGNRQTRATNQLDTSSAACDATNPDGVYFDMNSSTNKVTISVQSSGVDSETVTYIYGRPQVEITNGDNQEGAPLGQLAKYLGAKVVDERGRGVSGVAVKFTSAEDTAMFLPVIGTTVYINGTNVWAGSFGDIDDTLSVTRVDDPAAAGTVLVQTDRNGEAKVYFQLGETVDKQEIEAELEGSSTVKDTFTATASTAADAARITIVDGDGQSASADEALKEALVVMVTDLAGQIVVGETVTFTTDSGYLSAPLSKDPGVYDSTRTDDTPRNILVKTDATGRASVRYNVGDLPGAKEVDARIAGSGGRIREVTFNVNGGGRATPPPAGDADDTAPPPASVSIVVPSSVTGTAGGTARLIITASATATVTAGGINDNFPLPNIGSFTRSGTTHTSTLTLPNQVTSYSLTVFVRTAAGITTLHSVTVSTTAAAAQTGGTLTVRIDPFSGAPGTTATVTVTAADASAQPANVTVSLTATGGTLSSSSVATGTTGTTTVTLTRGSTAGTENFVTVSGPSGYTSVNGRFVIAGPVGRDTTVGAAENLDDYDGNNQMGSLNSPLPEPFIVEVVDANDNPVEDARVRFRTTIGSGRFSPRAFSRTDEEGLAEITFTPTSTGRIRVVATVAGADSTAAFIVQGGEPADALVKVSGDTQSGTPGNALANPFVVEVQDEDGEPLAGHRVTFSVTAGGGSLSETSAAADEDGRAETTLTLGSERGVNSVRASVTGVDPVTFSTSIDAKILVAAANRPVMYWIAGGGLYSLSGAKEANIAESANGVAVGGGKIYWTEMTGESGGTVNSANLDGTDVTELASIFATPIGIAVDAAGSKLYWTNASGRIQSANLDGSGIKNVMQNLSDPTDIVVSNGFIYWTEGGNSVRRVNISGQKIAIDVAVNLDSVGGLAVGGGKVYWTEMTSASAGTVNGANLNGTNFETLATLLSAPMGISVDTAGSKLYWTNARGRVQSANLNGNMIKNVVEGLISPSKLAIGGANTEATATVTKKATTPAKKDNAKYDVNGDGAVDNTDASLVAAAMNTSNTKYDVNGDGTVNFLDLLLVFDNREDAAAAPTIVGMKLTAIQMDIIQEQIDLLIATNDRSPAALRTLIYMQQLLATARPEKTQLFANYPNPFNPETWIPYELATDTHVKITIYNTQGVVIRTLQFGHQSAGYYTGRDRAAYWDGRNALGEQVASGLYFYQLETDEMSSMRKMVILK